ncbi:MULTISPECIES: histidine kinase dimerization/phosphoacceptor domain -containing protein [unclassified Methylobacterium]|uniref:histidine kinase dimerization/phosphoacceptor domain -containing protein n=1 Tax=unclassified Methylobacterium TaxID=2615210 RepID=UPI0006F8ECE2|nr:MULTISPECIES: histidine kinase dimerization/phosphoacceptor domain -containing protein [unclassified Methylobacterium]KQP88135.1 histidine kinase [Methylobacterium sp. Leaf117]KQP94754.1 histidine kinase [Methylobacterium sp. Leaf113]MCK2055931.1 PAS domain-containing protein [Methylobacterium sp. 37f]
MERDDAWHLTSDLRVEGGKGDPFAAAIRATRMAMIVTNPRLDDNPIVFVNDAFLRLSGYERSEIMGQNCRFLQGQDTDPNAIGQIRAAVDARRDIAIDILNYRKDGSPFWNALYMSPVITEGGDLHFFFASQLDVTDRVDAQMRTQNEKEHFEREVARRTRELSDALAAKTMLVHEVDHRVKNNLQMVASLLTMQTRSITDPTARDAMKSMLTRVEALGTVHKRLYQSRDVERFDVAEFTRELATDLVRGSGHAGITLHLDLEPVEVPVEKAPPVALMMNELITNALKHAFPGDRPGRLSIRVHPDGRFFGIRIVDDGIGMPPDVVGARSFGKRLVESLARQLNASLTWQPGHPGTLIEIRLPRETPGAKDST